MSLRLFDANCRLGPSDFGISSAPLSAAQMIDEMDRVEIEEALVHHATAAGYSPEEGNQQLAADIAGHPRLHPCWVLMPHHTGEMAQPETLVPRMLAAGGRAARIMPNAHRFSLCSWSIDALFSELERRRLPLFLDSGRTHWAENVLDYDQVARICGAFPRLPLVLVREGIGSTRYLYALMSRFENLLLEISYYQASDGVADITRRFGARRLLFGTGLPDYSAGSPISMLERAEISEAERRLIAGDNLRRLLEEVYLDAIG